MAGHQSGIVVIGGVNIDIGGRSDRPLVAHDSNPGRVRVSQGGVGRNIAHNLSLLGLHVRFLTALSDDGHSRDIRRSCEEAGIDLSLSVVVPDTPTSTYLYLEDSSGELALAVIDTRLCDHITPAYLEQHLDAINAAELVFADANLTAEALAYLADHCTAPLFTDPVSTAKAVRVRPILDRLHTVKPNRIETELLTGVRITDRDSLEKAAETLLATGLKRAFITLGEKGVYAAEGDRRVLLPPMKADIISTNGAGDAFTAALGWAYLNGLDPEETCRAASAAAAIAMESAATISPALSASALRERIKQITG